MKYYITPTDDDSRHYDNMLFDGITEEVTIALLTGDYFAPDSTAEYWKDLATIYVSNEIFDRYIWNPITANNQESIRRFMGPLMEDQEEIRRQHDVA